MLSSKNDTIKELRSKLNQYEPNTDDLKEEDWGWVAEGDGTTSGNEMNIKLDLFNVTGIKAIKIFYNSFFGLYCIIYIFSWKINIGSFKVVFNLVKKYPTYKFILSSCGDNLRIYMSSQSGSDVPQPHLIEKTCILDLNNIYFKSNWMEANIFTKNEMIKFIFWSLDENIYLV